MEKLLVLAVIGMLASLAVTPTASLQLGSQLFQNQNCTVLETKELKPGYHCTCVLYRPLLSWFTRQPVRTDWYCLIFEIELPSTTPRARRTTTNKPPTTTNTNNQPTTTNINNQPTTTNTNNQPTTTNNNNPPTTTNNNNQPTTTNNNNQPTTTSTNNQPSSTTNNPPTTTNEPPTTA